MISYVSGILSIACLTFQRLQQRLEKCDCERMKRYLLLNRDVMADTAVFASDADAFRVVWRLGSGVERCTTLRRGVVVVVLGKVSSVLCSWMVDSHESRHNRGRPIR